jgi:hypothetical protein
MAELSPKQQAIHRLISGCLDKIRACFLVDVKVMLVIRNPHATESDMFVGNDDVESTIATLRKLQQLEE